MEKKLGLYCVSQSTSVYPRDSSLHIFSTVWKRYFLYSFLSSFLFPSLHFKHQIYIPDMSFENSNPHLNQEKNVSLVHNKVVLFSSNETRILHQIFMAKLRTTRPIKLNEKLESKILSQSLFFFGMFPGRNGTTCHTAEDKP